MMQMCVRRWSVPGCQRPLRSKMLLHRYLIHLQAAHRNRGGKLVNRPTCAAPRIDPPFTACCRRTGAEAAPLTIDVCSCIQAQTGEMLLVTTTWGDEDPVPAAFCAEI